jgi:hypothetical protein
LGVILFEMLAGRGPFQSTTPLSIAFKHLTDPIPSIRLFRPALPMEVEGILNKALAKDRELRYSTASEMARDLQAVSTSFQESEKPVVSAVSTAQSRDAATEVDVDENPESVAEVSPRPKIDSQPRIQVSQSLVQPPIRQTPGPVKRSSLGPLQVAAIAGVGLILLGLCSSLGLFGTWAGLQGFFKPGTPTVAPTVPATAAPTQANTVQEVILFTDDFSDPNSGWPDEQNDQGAYRYQPDGYHISVTGASQTLWAFTEGIYDDSRISVDATPQGEGGMNYHGLICRFQDDQSFYYFAIRGDGQFTIGKYKDNEFRSLFSEGWRQSAVIRQGMQTNHLEAECTGNVLRLTVNNVLVGEATDMDFASGFSGILAAALDDQDFEVRFNNFLVTK